MKFQSSKKIVQPRLLQQRGDFRLTQSRVAKAYRPPVHRGVVFCHQRRSVSDTNVRDLNSRPELRLIDRRYTRQKFMSRTVVLLFIEFIFHGYNVVSARMRERAH